MLITILFLLNLMECILYYNDYGFKKNVFCQAFFFLWARTRYGLHYIGWMILWPIYKRQFFFCFAPSRVGTALLIVSGARGRVITILVFFFILFSLPLSDIFLLQGLTRYNMYLDYIRMDDLVFFTAAGNWLSSFTIVSAH